MAKKPSEKLESGKTLNRLGEVTSFIGGTAIVVMIAFVVVNMLLRRLFNSPIRGFYDITGLLGVIFYSFSIAYAGIKGAHISVRFLVKHLPERVQKVIKRITQVLLAITSLLIAYAAANIVWEQWLQSEVTTDLKIPLNPFRIIIILAFIFMAVLVVAGVRIYEEEE